MLFLLKEDELGTQQNNCYPMSHCNQTNIEGKNCVWTAKYKRLLEMCIVQHAELKSVFKFQPIKRLVSTTVISAKPLLLKSPLWTRNRKLRCLAVMVHIVLQEKPVATTKNKGQLHFEEISPPITTKHIRT